MSKVAVIPLAKFTSEADHKLVADLATSVERTAVVKYLRTALSETSPDTFYSRLFSLWVDKIEQGKHIP